MARIVTYNQLSTCAPDAIVPVMDEHGRFLEGRVGNVLWISQPLHELAWHSDAPRYAYGPTLRRCLGDERFMLLVLAGVIRPRTAGPRPAFVCNGKDVTP